MLLRYEVGKVSYWLMPQVTGKRGKKPHLVGFGMYDADAKYIGYWPRDQVPTEVIQMAEQACWVFERIYEQLEKAAKEYDPKR